MEAAIDIMFVNEKISEYINPIPAGGGGQFDPSPVVFYITQKVLV